MEKKFNKGQGAMGIVVLAVSVIIGIYLIATVYQSLPTTGLPGTATTAIESTLDIGVAGMTLLAVGIIVAAAMFILTVMGSK